MSEKIKSVLEFVTTGINGVNSQIKSISNPAASACNSIGKLNASISKLTAISGVTASIQAFGAAKAVMVDAASAVKGVYDEIFNRTKEFAEQADQISKTSRLINMSVQDYQGMEYAAQRSGMSIETIDSSLQKFSVSTGQAINGNKTLASEFEALGVKIKNSDGSIRNNKDVLLDVADAYTKLKSTQDKAFVSQSLFGKSGLQMAEMFSGGKSGVESLLKDYQDLGGGISEVDAKNAEEFDDQLLRMDVSLTAIKNKAMGMILPAFTDFFKTVTGYVKDHRKEIDETISKIAKKIPDMLKTLSEKVPEIIDDIQSIIKKIEGIIEVVGPWKSVFIAIGAVVGGGILMAFTAIGVALATIVPVLIMMTPIILPIVAAVALVSLGIAGIVSIIYQVYDNWAMLKSFIIDDCIGGIIDAISPFTNKISSGFSWVANKIKTVFDTAKNIILNVFRSVLSEYLLIVDKITSTLSNLPVIGDIFKDVNVGVHGMMDSDFMHPERNENTDVMKQISETYSEIKSNSTTTQRFAVDFSGMPRGVTVKPPEKGGDFDYSAGYLFGGGL